ncbi:hypothetical protein [Pseudanabaena sp. FACHB-2040]|uniref:hypothetical protein n=1 Tax=Pseudanabaena sp. FACHB-2040 TaxID=2692859 RepID=UPI0016820568|nr:hypothetical protein [Pseudanabaena sp. FACHB-2040]MBD2261415.1 hypothetical protein [Pseudanabaena sp. FACHB-2040]
MTPEPESAANAIANPIDYSDNGRELVPLPVASAVVGVVGGAIAKVFEDVLLRPGEDGQESCAISSAITV